MLQRNTLASLPCLRAPGWALGADSPVVRLSVITARFITRGAIGGLDHMFLAFQFHPAIPGCLASQDGAIGRVARTVLQSPHAAVDLLVRMSMTLAELQQRIRDLFGAKDARRGVEGTFMWFMEEVGELAAALRVRSDTANLTLEFADVLAWLATLANIAGVDLEEAMARKYGGGCPRCQASPCSCDTAKP